MKKKWNALSLAVKMISVTIVTILMTMAGLTWWLSWQMQNDVMTMLNGRSQIIQRQIEATRAYLAEEYVAKIKQAGEGRVKVAQEHTAPNTVPLPATAIREIAEELSKEGMFNARVISSKPLNPANKPKDSFEEDAIKALESGAKEVVRAESLNGIMTFRRMTPDIISNEACIGCHTDKKMGEMVGAMSLQVPMTKAMDQVNQNINMLYIVAGLSAFLMAAVLFISLRLLVIRPVQTLQSAVHGLGQGNLASRASVSTYDEIGQLAQAFNEMGASMETASTKQQEMMTAAQAQAAEIKGITDAIDKAQASIEFKLDGTIMTANDNFLKTLGYSLHEIKGQHHRMFCEPAYTSSGEYLAFWQKLSRGEFDAGVYKRLGKGGKEIWIQASYNPIVDAAGKVYKVVKFASDITAQKKAQFEMEALVTEAQAVLGSLAANDLTQSMGGSYQGELEKIKQSINAVVQNLTETMTTVKEAVGNVSTGAEQITKGNEDLAQRTSEQASALEETSASMEEMTSTVKQNADNAKQANQLAIAARDIADKGGSITTKAVDAMGEINKSSKKIADIITVIDEIAFQTNLLALNAAVEAARAGEHGRGFAVVAAEVRNLAQRSATAAKEIKGLINESIQRVNDGSELVNQSGKTLDEIVNSVKRVTDIIAEITAASQEQAQGIDQVNKAIMQMDETTQQNAALVEETTSASQSMKEQAKELARQVEGFKVASGGSSAPASAAARPVSKPMSVAKPMAKKPSAAPKAAPKPVAASSSRASDDFEEF